MREAAIADSQRRSLPRLNSTASVALADLLSPDQNIMLDAAGGIRTELELQLSRVL